MRGRRAYYRHARMADGFGRIFPRDGSAALHAVSFYRFENGRIARMDEYWGDDGAAPEWRRSMEIGVPIGEK